MSWIVIALLVWTALAVLVWAMCVAASHADAQLPGPGGDPVREARVVPAPIAVVDVVSLRLHAHRLADAVGSDRLEVFAGEHRRRVVCCVGVAPIVGVRSAITADLVRDGRVVGAVMAIRTAASPPFDDADHGVLQNAAASLARVMDVVSEDVRPEPARFERAAGGARVSYERQ